MTSCVYISSSSIRRFFVGRYYSRVGRVPDAPPPPARARPPRCRNASSADANPNLTVYGNVDAIGKRLIEVRDVRRRVRSVRSAPSLLACSRPFGWDSFSPSARRVRRGARARRSRRLSGSGCPPGSPRAAGSDAARRAPAGAKARRDPVPCSPTAGTPPGPLLTPMLRRCRADAVPMPCRDVSCGRRCG